MPDDESSAELLRLPTDGIPSYRMGNPVQPLSSSPDVVGDRRVPAHDGTLLRYRQQGSGPAVVLVHGVGASLDSWDGIVARLDDRFTITRADLRGHGTSGLITQCRMSDFVDDVVTVLDDGQVGRFHLVGFSLGGLIAQHVALAHPERVLTLSLISTVSGRSDEERARVLERARLIRQNGIESVVRAAEDRWFSPAFKARHPEMVAHRLEQLTANDHASYAAAYEVFAEADRGLEVERIAVPTLVVTGEQDIGSNPRMARLLHDKIAGSELHILPEYRHSILLEAPNEVADLLLDFLNRRGATEASRL